MADDQSSIGGRRNHSSASPFEPVYGYSRAVRVGNRIDVAGCAPIEPDGSSTLGDAGVQAARCLTIIREALEALIRCGIDRVLTSGGAVRSIDGVDTLARMVATRGDVEIMAGGGIRTEDIPAILATGVQAVHLSARRQAGLDAPAGPGGGTAGHDITDPALVVAAVTATRG